MKTWLLIKRFIQPLKGYPKSLSILLFRGVFFGLYGSILAICIKNMVDYLPLKDWNMFLRYFIVMVIVLAIKDILGYFVRINDFRLQNSIQGKLYLQYLSQYFQGKNTIVDQMGTGKSNSVMIRGIDNRVGILRRIPLNFTAIVIGITTSLTLVASSIGVWGFVAVFILFIGSFGLAQYGNKISAKWRKLRRDLYNDIDRSIIKMIMSKFEILQNNQSSFELTGLNENILRIYEYYLRESKGMIISFDLQRTAIDLLRVGLILYIGWGVYQGTHTVGELALVRMLLNTLGGNVEDLNEYITNFHQQRIYVDKLRMTFDDLPQILGYSSGSEYKPQQGSIQMKNVNYSYQDTEQIFQNFSLSIIGGNRIALVGPSGGGKSTLMKLIAGYLHPLSGDILVDGQALPTPQNCHSEGSETKGRIHMDPSLHSGGQNTDHISLQSYYPHIGYLTQEPSVFDGTIWENLTYGLQNKMEGQDPEKSDKNSERSDKSNKIVSDLSEPFPDLYPHGYTSLLSGDIDKVIKLARCEFIHEFKDGLMTEIGEKGVRLSGGQRQRLAIAKIMLKNPAIILLDEPTSALDSENEELVTQALNELFKGKTVIVIAHRLQTVKHADQILYIDKSPSPVGRGSGGGSQIIESGTHNELIAMKGKYHKMVELQSGF